MAWHSIGLVRQCNNDLDIAGGEEACASIYRALEPVLVNACQQSDPIALFELQLARVLRVEVVQRLTVCLLVAASCTVT